MLPLSEKKHKDHASVPYALASPFRLADNILKQKRKGTSLTGQVIPINYKAHIPAGIAFAGGVSMIAGWPVVIPALVGGAIGGALPDIDIEGSAIEKMGDKTARVVERSFGEKRTRSLGVRRFTGALSVVGKGIDMIFLAPIARAWRFLSKKVFGNIYLKLYNLGSFGPDKLTLGEKLHWNGDSKPWAHRGGITHSISFMVTSCVLTLPVAFIFQSPEFLIGVEAGIASHLFADSLCKSGVKYLFPFQPRIGFDNDNGAGRGRDIRLLPKGLQVVTGKDRITNKELEEYPDRDKALHDRRLRNRERMWQWIFKLAALALFICLLIGVAGPGGVAVSAFGQDFSDAQSPVTAIVQQADEEQSTSATSGQQDSGNNGSDEASASAGTDGDNEEDNNGIQVPEGSATATGDVAKMGGDLTGADMIAVQGDNVNSKPEIKGVTSLTFGDIDIKDLPRGVVKMPDESLWIIGVGPVTRDNINNNPLWQFTDEEKTRLIAAASAQRLDGIPTSVSNLITNSGAFISDAAKDAADAAAGAANNAKDDAEEAAEGPFAFISELLGGGSGYKGGFLGLTTWTDS